MGDSGTVRRYLRDNIIGKSVNNNSFLCKTRYNLPDLKVRIMSIQV